MVPGHVLVLRAASQKSNQENSGQLSASLEPCALWVLAVGVRGGRGGSEAFCCQQRVSKSSGRVRLGSRQTKGRRAGTPTGEVRTGLPSGDLTAASLT